MKRLFFFILALQIISSGQFLAEAVKFHDLVDHFLEHKSGEHPLGVIEFFKLHYFDAQHEGSDPVRHASLPLYQTNIHLAFFYLQQPEQFNLPSFDAVTLSAFNPISKGLMPQCHQVSVFQPPRTV